MLSSRFWRTSSLSFFALTLRGAHASLVSYANDFVDPDYIVNGNFGKHTQGAQDTIVAWARQSTVGSPWCT